VQTRTIAEANDSIKIVPDINYVFSAVLNSTARPVKIMVVHQDSKRGAKYKSHLFISLLHEI
jgi:hypothetical protein